MVNPLDDYMVIIENIAKAYSLKYKLEREDIQQTLYVWWISKQGTRLTDYLNDEDKERGKAYIVKSLTNVANEYCRKETAHRAWTYPDDVFLYSMKHITSLLPFVETPERWTGFARAAADGSEGRVKGDPATGGDAMAAYADMRTAWGALSEEDREVLRARFNPSATVPYAVVAEEFDVDEQIVRKRVERALGRVQRRLGGSRRRHRRAGGVVDFVDVEPVRRSMSNAAAQAATGRDWSGD